MSTKRLNDVALEDYYQSLFVMHGSVGWREFMADVEHMEREHNRVDNVADQRELDRRHGQLEIIRWLATHKERTEAAYVQLIEDQEGVAAAPESTGGVARVVEPGETDARDV